MATDTPPAKERIDAIPPSARVLGIDADGRPHLYHLEHPLEIWVLTADHESCVHYVAAPDRSLVDWALFVDDRCGWDRRHRIEEPAFSGLFDGEPVPPTRLEVIG